MKRFASFLSRAVLAALLLTCVFGGIARADDHDLYGSGDASVNGALLPEDPGIGP